MPFCSSCGTDVGGGRFCPKCGSPQQTAAPPPQPGPAYAPQPPQPPMPPPAKGSPILKIVLFVVVGLGILGVIGVIGAFYAVKTVAQRAKAEMKAKGVDLDDLRKAASQARETKPGCNLLSEEDAGRILGVKIERSEGNQAGDSTEYCKFWTDEKTLEKASEKAQQERKEEAENSGSTNLDSKQLDDLVKGINASGGDGPTPIMSLAVFRGTAKIVMTGMKGSSLLLGTKMKSVDGPWDEAIFAPLNSAIVVRKADTAALIDLRQVPDGEEKGLTLAKAVSKGLK